MEYYKINTNQEQYCVKEKYSCINESDFELIKNCENEDMNKKSVFVYDTTNNENSIKQYQRLRRMREFLKKRKEEKHQIKQLLGLVCLLQTAYEKQFAKDAGCLLPYCYKGNRVFENDGFRFIKIGVAASLRYQQMKDVVSDVGYDELETIIKIDCQEKTKYK